MAEEPLLRMQGIVKSFPGVRALSEVDFEAQGGEIHALMGENGAGKSTLVKVLTGVYPRDGGSIRFEGEPIRPNAPIEAERLGISTVYQEVNLIPHMTVAENITLGRQEKKFGFLNWRQIRRRAREALARLDLEIDVNQEVCAYSMAIQQMVAIARALDVRAKLLILDEPTSSLDKTETAELFFIMRKLRAEGLGIVFITHFLEQVYEVCDRITVLRNGERVGEYRVSELPRLALIGKMLGRDPAEVAQLGAKSTPAPRNGNPRSLINAEGIGRKGVVAPLDLTVGEGEVVGLAGLLGSGRSETARLLFGIDRIDRGSVSVAGTPANLNSPRKAIGLGFGYCSEDRKGEGIVPDLSVRENIILALQARRGVRRKIPMKEQLRIAERFISALGIKTPSPETPIKSLSGGNQQKVLLARWLATDPRFLILDEPTRGIDVGAKAEIEKLTASISDKGTAVLFISSELGELVRNCRRTVVLRDREKIGELSGNEVREHKIMEMIAGAQEVRDGG